MSLLYVSDLHLRAPDSKKCTRFAAFLREVPATGDTLVLGGDIFDLLVGDKKHFREKYAVIREELQALAAKGVEIHYLEGNHDFHLGSFLPGAKIQADEFPLDWGGKKIWVAHGDMIDPEDTGYHFLRKTTRSPPFRVFLSLVPGALVGAIGDWSSRQSRKYHDIGDISSARRERLRALYKSFSETKIAEGYDFVLIGHSHIADQLRLGRGEYLNLGFAEDQIPYGVLAQGADSFAVKKYP